MEELKQEGKDNCKGCRASVRVLDEEIKHMLQEIEDSGNFELADMNLYEHRMKKCETCKYLQYNNTCAQCGCIVQIRARILKNSCPFPGKSNW
jgi:hypothetical protein